MAVQWKDMSDVHDFVANILCEFICDKNSTKLWIKKSNLNVKNHFPSLLLRLFVLICLLHLSSGNEKYLQLLRNLLGQKNITTQLPFDFCNFLQKGKKRLGFKVFAEAFNVIGNPLVISKLRNTSSQIACPDAVFVDLTTCRKRELILEMLFPSIVGNVNGDTHVKFMSETSVKVNEISIKEIPISGSPLECNEQGDPSKTFDIPQNVKIQTVDGLGSKRYSDPKLESSSNVSTQFPSANDHLQVHQNFPVAINIKPVRPIVDSKVLNQSASLHSPVSILQDSDEGSISEHAPTTNQFTIEEGLRLHIPLKTDNHVVSDFEGEPSSIIACALSLLKDSSEMSKIDGDVKESGITSKSTDSLHDSLDSDSVHSTGSVSSEESRSFRATEDHSKEFRALRNCCCPSEIDYIASLSRCMNWDAKSGKSKSFFAKTLDERFIVKEIKKTKLEAFLGFSSLYFKHMRESFESGSQTCLATVLGIYQVTRRQIKSGKEVKHDLMVMENLTYNRNIVRQYDLKGALFERYTSDATGAEDVLLDQNLWKT
ncbi:unnamed protein product [Vicia faba]|uniref:PIPK domain-containing protein n=1 Tax=Vicia faba TaxID=3906 RepID=A0AAV0ZS45_VICFA|nr:unnamed protein product [Vicia faba]